MAELLTTMGWKLEFAAKVVITVKLATTTKLQSIEQESTRVESAGFREKLPQLRAPPTNQGDKGETTKNNLIGIATSLEDRVNHPIVDCLWNVIVLNVS